MADTSEQSSRFATASLRSLRHMAFSGVPDACRGEVWRRLLGIATEETADEYAETDKENYQVRRVRGEVARYVRAQQAKGCAVVGEAKNWSEKELIDVIERVLSAFFNHHVEIEYQPGFVSMAVAFAYCLEQERDVYFCFCRMMEKIGEWMDEKPLHERVAEFVSLLRDLIPELYNHFEEEEVDIREWATSWFRFALARELPLPCLLRLWDTYFSSNDELNLHPFVCLALLVQCKDGFQELEHSELRTVLSRMPELDMSQVIDRALSMKQEHLLLQNAI